jgi:hypothetical protein
MRPMTFQKSRKGRRAARGQNNLDGRGAGSVRRNGGTGLARIRGTDAYRWQYPRVYHGKI